MTEPSKGLLCILQHIFRCMDQRRVAGADCSVHVIYFFIFFFAVLTKRPNALSFLRLSKYDIS